MQLSSTSVSTIKELIQEAIRVLKRNSEESLLTDIYFYPNPSTGVLSIMDDEDRVLTKKEIEEWSDSEDEDDFVSNVTNDLTEILADLKESGVLDDINILMPYSFVLIDGNGESVEELLLMDDDLLIVNDTLLKGLDDELDLFLTNLLEE